MTVDSVAPSERSLVPFATPYLEVETPSISSLERTIVRELAQARLAAKRKKRKGGDQPDHNASTASWSSDRVRPLAARSV
jgi:hypothetical protein